MAEQEKPPKTKKNCAPSSAPPDDEPNQNKTKPNC